MALAGYLDQCGLWGEAVQEYCSRAGFETTAEGSRAGRSVGSGLYRQIYRLVARTRCPRHHAEVAGGFRSLGGVAHQRCTGRPRPREVGDTRVADADERAKAARAAVALSAQRAPAAGLCRGLSREDPLFARLAELKVDKMALFESKSVWAALRVWDDWREAAGAAAVVSGPQQEVALHDFMKSHRSATGPLATYNKLLWLQQYLRAPRPSIGS